ncbi:MAG: aldehyde dehydrogenase (NAD+) [Flammeovirgaceae bacterium]
METSIKQNTSITSNVFQLKREFFDTGSTLKYSFRSGQLKRLEAAIKRNEKEILAALHSDLRKSEMEAYMTEISIVVEEIKYLRKNLREWMRPIKRDTPLAMQPSTTSMRYEPKGVVLIVAPWNYPFQLVMDPLAGAIAAGCCAVVKPSEDAPAVAKVIEAIISEIFDPCFVSTVQGLGHEVVPELMNSFLFNHVFFTGSPQVGSAIAKMAAEKLTSTTLELGGKSPAIIDGTGNMKTTVKRLLWGKFMNAGQTCVSPDYVLVKEGFRDQFLEEAKKVIEDFFGNDPKTSASFPRIINLKRFEAVKRLMTSGDVAIGGQSDREDLYIAPTILTNVSLDDEVMKEEIFGPVLPIITWNTERDILDTVRRNRYPLACYYFGKDKALREFILTRIEFGGGCINNTLVQFGNPDLPVGGVQHSGSGHYHGFYSFECFSNAKTIVDSATWIDPSIKYPPYTKTKLSWIKRLLG